MTATTNLSSYLKHCITRWYDNAKIDYDVNGYFVSAETTENNLYITWVEEEEEHTMRIGYYKDFTAEQACKEAGCGCFEWKCFNRRWVICFHIPGQAYKRETAAEVMTKALADMGYDALTYCAID